MVAQVAGEHLCRQAQAHVGQGAAQGGQARHDAQLGKGRGGAEHQLLLAFSLAEAIEH
ncbi:hypothetical protein D3C78_1748150 [compost metagenome]